MMLRSRALRSRVTVCLYADGHQTEDGKQTECSDTEGESYLDKENA